MAERQALPTAVASGPARGWLPGLGGAALWTLAQHAAFFACAWGVSWWAGAQRFGAFGQGLALAAMLPAAVTLRLEYAGQLERRPRRAQSLFGLAETGALTCSVLLVALLSLASLREDVPAWLWAASLAVLPQAGMLVLASREARSGSTVLAAALRGAPAIVMAAVLALAWLLRLDEAIEWSIPLSAWLCWLPACAWLNARCAGAPRKARAARARLVAAKHWPFVRAELPAFVLNTSANHGQVLLIGLLAGDAMAGTAALALRIAMLPTSVFGLAMADRLRARVVAVGRGAMLLPMMRQSIRRMAGLSLATHAVAALGALALLSWVFPAQGPALVTVVLWLLPLGMVRFVASPLAFLLPWRGWLGLSLLGQCLLFACALLSVLAGFPLAGLDGVATVYAVSASFVYLGYVYAALKAVRDDT